MPTSSPTNPRNGGPARKAAYPIVETSLTREAARTGSSAAALIPTIFSGTDPTRFYSINGIGIPTAGGLFALWILVASAALLIRARQPSAMPAI